MDSTARLERPDVAGERQALFSARKTPADVLCSFCTTRQLNVTDYSFKRAAALGSEDFKGLRASKWSVACLFEDHTDTAALWFQSFNHRNLPTDSGHSFETDTSCVLILRLIWCCNCFGTVQRENMHAVNLLLMALSFQNELFIKA